MCIRDRSRTGSACSRTSAGCPTTPRVARGLREVRRAGERGRAVDRRQQHEVTARVPDRAAAERRRVWIAVPRAQVRHEPEEVLRRPGGVAAEARHRAAALAAGVDRQRGCARLMRSERGLEAALISGEVATGRSFRMLDLFYILLIVVLFGISLAMIRFFDRL